MDTAPGLVHAQQELIAELKKMATRRGRAHDTFMSALILILAICVVVGILTYRG